MVKKLTKKEKAIKEITADALTFVDEMEFAIGKSRICPLFGEIGLEAAAIIELRLQYFQLTETEKPVTILMNTPGGEIYNGLSIHDAIVSTTAKTPVTIIASGRCMSMGLVIMQSATKRIARRNTTFLLHEPEGRTEGKLSAMKNATKEADRMNFRLLGILSKRSGVPIKTLFKLQDRKELFIDAEEALKLNLIDEVVD